MAKRFGKKPVGDGDVRIDEATHNQDGDNLVDPALVARLETWFGDRVPEAEVEAAEFIPGFGYVEPESARDRWRRERATEAAERGTLWRDIDRRGQAAGALVEPLPPMTLPIEQPISRFDLDRWGIPEPPQEVPRVDFEDITESMRERVPQAVLRDLHRPVMNIPDIELEERVLDTATGADQTAMIRALIRARYRVELERLEPAGVQAREVMSELRTRLRDEPWEDARPENPTSWTTSAADMAEIMRWFMPGGGE